MSGIFCLLPGFFFLNFFHVPGSLFSQRLILIWFAYTFETLKAFHCGQIVSKIVFEDGKRKLCPNVSTIESKKQYFFFNCILWGSRQPWILHKSTSVMSSSLLKRHTHTQTHTDTHTHTPTTEGHSSWYKGPEYPRGIIIEKRRWFYR